MMRKTNDKEPGIIYMPYIMAEDVPLIVNGEISSHKTLKSRYALVDFTFGPSDNDMMI